MLNENIVGLTVSEFNQFAKLIYNQCGIKLPIEKKTLLESRLSKRLRNLSIHSYKEYLQLISSKEGSNIEIIHMIDVITTNKTDFFREPHHFEFIENVILPNFLHEGKRKINIWSAGCSSGEEPYTLAMVFENQKIKTPYFDYSIFASDISTEILKKASEAIYPAVTVKNIPFEIKRKYFLKSKDVSNPTVRIVPEIRNKVTFNRINFMSPNYSIYENFDCIFCRNVLIYFDRETQINVINKLLTNLKSGGYLFIGHSESLIQSQFPLIQIKPTIYRKK